MQRKINDIVICLWIGKTYTAKTSLGDFQVNTHEIPLLTQQAVISKGILVPYTNLQFLTPIPNTQLDLFCCDDFSFWCTTPKYVTNQQCGSQYTTSITNYRRLLVTKFFSSSTQWRSRRCLVTKPYGAQTQQLLQKRWTRAKLCLRLQIVWTNFA